MAIILIVCIVVTAASAAPPVRDGLYQDWQQELFDRMELNKHQEIYPAKRSNYGNLYISPCAAAAASAHMTPYAQHITAHPGYPSAAASTPYSYSHAAYQTVPAHQGHYGHSYYRTDDDLQNEQEMLGFSDMDHVTFDHVPMARYSYGAAPTAQIGGNTGGGQSAASGPVVGVFSNSNVGGCSVPLLVSCSPSIAHGRIVKTQPYYSGGSPAQPGNMYRGVDEQLHHDEAEGHQETAHSSSDHSIHNSKSINDKHQ